MTSSLDSLPKVGAPAARALQAAGYIELRQLAGARRSDLAALHGVGPKALGIIEAALKEHGFNLT
jgi:predicted flap endonuclease-1-like 5' DNA nuclease